MLEAIAAWFGEIWANITWRPVQRGKINWSTLGYEKVFEDLKYPELREEATARLRTALVELRSKNLSLRDGEDYYAKKVTPELIKKITGSVGK